MRLTVCFVLEISEINLGTGIGKECSSLGCRAFDASSLLPVEQPRRCSWPCRVPAKSPLTTSSAGGSRVSANHWKEQKLPCCHLAQINMQIRRQMHPRNVGHSGIVRGRRDERWGIRGLSGEASALAWRLPLPLGLLGFFSDFSIRPWFCGEAEIL